MLRDDAHHTRVFDAIDELENALLQTHEVSSGLWETLNKGTTEEVNLPELGSEISRLSRLMEDANNKHAKLRELL